MKPAPDTDTIDAARTLLREAIDRDGPAALAPAALGCLIVDLECLAHAASHLKPTGAPPPEPWTEHLHHALDTIAAYRTLAKRTRDNAATMTLFTDARRG